jgi:hypothetical protein
MTATATTKSRTVRDLENADVRRAQRLRREIERLRRLERLGVLAAGDVGPRVAELAARRRRRRGKQVERAFTSTPDQ